MANAPPSKEIELLLEEIINLLPAGPDIQYSFHNNHIVLYSLTFPTDMYDILYGEYAKTKVDGLQKHYATPYADAFINIMEERPKDACVVYKRHNDDKDRIIWSFLYSLIIKDIVLIVEKSPFDLNERIVRLLAPFELLCRESERQEEHFPLNKKTLINYFPGSQKYKDIDDSPFYGRVCTTRAQALKLEEDYLFNRSAPFHMSELYDFQRGDYRELGWKLVKLDFFTPALRSQLLSCVINSVYVKSTKMERFTVHDLLHKEYISSYFVLHDGPLNDPNSKSLRMLLKTWTKGKWTLPMPLHTIRDYFGETVAFYFAFIEYYTEWLRYSAVIGVGALIYGIISAVTDNRLTSLFDNEGSVVFSLVLVTWSLLFLKFWKRRVNFLCFAWDLDNFDENTVVRPQWVGTHERISDVTGEIEEYEPFWRQNLRTTISLMFMALIVVFLVGLFVATVYFQFLLSKTSFSSYGSVVASSAISLAQILLLGPLGSTIAIKLTNFENFQAQSVNTFN